MDLSVIIVSYNVRHFLEQALTSVEKAIQGIQAEVIVVDNHSEDDSVSMVTSRFPWIKLIVNEENHGFAVANNQAIHLAKSRFILLLNPDTIVEEETFHKCLAFMAKHPEAGALGVRMIDGGGNFLPESKRGFPTPFVAFCKAFGLSRLFPHSKLFNKYHLGFMPEFQTAPVDVLAGAFMFIRKEALDKAGLLDERFFMYGEDIDLSYRLNKAGYQNFYFPEATIIHYKGESTRKGSLNYIRIFYQAMILFAKKHYYGPGKSLYILFIQLAVYFRAMLTLFRNMFKRSWVFIRDLIFIYFAVILIKDFWANYYYNDPDYYPTNFLWINAPLYATLWLAGLHLSGAYDRRYDLWTAVRGVLWGTLVIAAVYGFLDAPYRTSRAIIVIATVVVLAGTLSFRMLAHYFRFGKLFSTQHEASNLLIVGSIEECQRAEDLLQQMDRRKNTVGWIAVTDDYDKTTFLNHLRRLDDIVRVFQIDEIIFCGRDVRSDHMMQWMNLIGSGPDYRILPDGGLSIIGSASSENAGELYTLDVRYKIADPVHRRHKRLSDLVFGVVMLLFAPLLVWFQQSPSRFLSNTFLLLVGLKTMVGYDEHWKFLPALPHGILSPQDAYPQITLDQSTIRHLCFLYARDYRVPNDMFVFLRNLKRLDRP